LNSSIYWGNSKAEYSPARRTDLPNESAAGVVAADLNGDGWVDLAVSNHVQNGDHHTRSLIFWNRDGTFDRSRTTSLPTVGPHMMTGVDIGNIMTRRMDELYTSPPYDAGSAATATTLSWNGATPFDSRLQFEVRGAKSAAELEAAAWLPLAPSSTPGGEITVRTRQYRWWQYRAHFLGGRAAWPTLSRVKLELIRAN
jgi:hypothetical protein